MTNYLNISLDFELSSTSEFISEAACDDDGWSQDMIDNCFTLDCYPNEQYCTTNTIVFVSSAGASPGDKIPFTFSIISDEYEVEDYHFDFTVSENFYSYPTSVIIQNY